MNQTRENYTPGYTPNAVDFMSRRTAESHAAFFLPHLKADTQYHPIAMRLRRRAASLDLVME
jgi:hypothetical protein